MRDSGTSEQSVLQTTTLGRIRFQCSRKRGERWRELSPALVGEAEAIASNTEEWLRRDAAAESVDGAVGVARLEVRRAQVSPGFLWCLVKDVFRKGLQRSDRVLITLLVDQHHTQRVPRFAKVGVEVEGPTRMPFAVAEPALGGPLRAKREVEERDQVVRLGVVLVELDGAERVLEGLSELAPTKPKIASDVVLALTLPHGIPRAGTGGGARTGGEGNRSGQRGDGNSKPTRALPRHRQWTWRRLATPPLGGADDPTRAKTARRACRPPRDRDLECPWSVRIARGLYQRRASFQPSISVSRTNREG